VRKVENFMDRATFIRPIAHRGLHDMLRGRIENTAVAFEAGIARGYGLECDLQPLADGTPVVFHDYTLDRLTTSKGRLDQLTPAAAKRMRYKGALSIQDASILTYGELLDLTAGRVPLLVDVKSDWRPPNPKFLSKVAKLTNAYKGPLALMSFDPQVMTLLAELAPNAPRGIISGLYHGDGWWPDQLSRERSFRLTHLLESGPIAASFYAYHVEALPTPVTRYVREVAGLPLFAWTVCNVEQRRRAVQWADAPIFEGFEA
jgi:glycerophosphoryl diester phosphodiesterase